MRYISTLLLLLTFSSSWSQTELQKKIKNVENGLTLQRTVPPNQPIVKKNILERMRDYYIPGASVAVINRGVIEWTKTYGVADASSGEKITKETLFQAGALGNVVTGIAALSLVKDGKIDLDENVNNKLVSWKVKENELTQENPVTLRTLLSHSAGFADNYGFLGYAPDSKIPSPVQILNQQSPAKSTKAMTVKSIPGKVELYSGGGYLIIQVLIEDLTSKSFGQYVEETIFKPLQMEHTTYNERPDRELGLSIAFAHRPNGKSFKGKKYNIYPEKAAAGPWTTAEDLAKLIIEIQKENRGESDLILNQKLVKEFLTPQINYRGLGASLKGLDKVEAFWQAGQSLGFSGIMYGLTGKGQGAIILLNSDNGDLVLQEFVTSVAQEYKWPVMQPVKCQTIPPQMMQSLIGKYENLDKNRTIFIESVGNGIGGRLSRDNQIRTIFRISQDQYTFKDAQDYYRIVVDNSGATLWIDYTESIGKNSTLKKVQ